MKIMEKWKSEGFWKVETSGKLESGKLETFGK